MENRNRKLLLTFLFSLLLTVLHWIGLIAGGLLIGYFSRSLKEAVFLGLLFGFLVFLSFLAYLAAIGLLEKFLLLSPVPLLTLTFSTALPALSASITNFFSPRMLKHS